MFKVKWSQDKGTKVTQQSEHKAKQKEAIKNKKSY